MKSFCDIIMPDLTRLPALLEETRQKQLSNGGPLYKLFNEKMGQFFLMHHTAAGDDPDALVVAPTAHARFVQLFLRHAPFS